MSSTQANVVFTSAVKILAVNVYLMLGGPLLIVALVWTSFEAYTALDKVGWVIHSHNTHVTVKGEWPEGEYLTCGMLLIVPQNGGGLPVPDKALDCPEAVVFGDAVAPGAFSDRIWPVRYYGRIDRLDKWFISWQCRRDAEYLTCKALD